MGIFHYLLTNLSDNPDNKLQINQPTSQCECRTMLPHRPPGFSHRNSLCHLQPFFTSTLSDQHSAIKLVFGRRTACQVEPAVSSDFSSSTTSFMPPLARWYATLTPTHPPPMMTVSAVSFHLFPKTDDASLRGGKVREDESTTSTV